MEQLKASEQGNQEIIKVIQEKSYREITDLLQKVVKKLAVTEPDLMEIEKEIRGKMLCLGSSILEAAVEIKGTGYQGAIIKNKNGVKYKFINNRTKELVTLLGEIKISRAYYYSENCKTGYIPLDEELDIKDTNFSPGVRESVGIISAEVPFEKGAYLLKKLAEISISKQRVEHISEEIGKLIEKEHVQKQQELWEFKENNIDKENEKNIESLYISADGTCVNTYEGWKEVKSGVIFDAKRIKGEPVRGKTTYIGTFESSENFGKRLYNEAYKMGLERAREVIYLGDGAKWIWNEAKINFPGCIEIVDWFHASEKLWDIGKMLYGQDGKAIRKWVDKKTVYLEAGRIEDLIISLKRIRGPTVECREKIIQVIGYYETNKERMRYKKFKDKGYFISSGVVESSCKHVIADRLKKSGMRWLIEGANAILQLRLCFINKEWEQFWKNRRNYY